MLGKFALGQLNLSKMRHNNSTVRTMVMFSKLPTSYFTSKVFELSIKSVPWRRIPQFTRPRALKTNLGTRTNITSERSHKLVNTKKCRRDTVMLRTKTHAPPPKTSRLFFPAKRFGKCRVCRAKRKYILNLQTSVKDRGQQNLRMVKRNCWDCNTS